MLKSEQPLGACLTRQKGRSHILRISTSRHQALVLYLHRNLIYTSYVSLANLTSPHTLPEPHSNPSQPFLAHFSTLQHADPYQSASSYRRRKSPCRAKIPNVQRPRLSLWKSRHHVQAVRQAAGQRLRSLLQQLDVRQRRRICDMVSGAIRHVGKT
jgi:hypothetical protein